MFNKRDAFLQVVRNIFDHSCDPTEDIVLDIFQAAQFFFGSDPDSTKYEWETVVNNMIRIFKEDKEND